MIATWFSNPVPVAVGIAGTIRNIENAQEAVAVLESGWPRRGTEKFRIARRACRSAMLGETMPSVARSAFVEAAEEAHILAGGGAS